MLARDEADLVVQVADARNVRRALMLTGQLAAFGKPMVLVLNMVDEALARGIVVDASAAGSRRFGIPVIEMVAVEGRGLPELRGALACAARPHVPVHPHRERSRSLGARGRRPGSSRERALAVNRVRKRWPVRRGGR